MSSEFTKFRNAVILFVIWIIFIGFCYTNMGYTHCIQSIGTYLVFIFGILYFIYKIECKTPIGFFVER